MSKTNKKFVDAYGQYVWGYLNGERKPEIIERDDNYISIGKRFSGDLYFSEYPKWSPLDKKGIKHAKGKVLDIGCGAGRHSLYLQGKGFDVTGIDNSPLAIEVCKKRGLKKALVLPIEKIDNLKPNKFDTIVMLGHNFGLFGNLKKAKTLLKKMKTITSEEAIIIANINDPYKTDNPLHLKYQRTNIKKGRMGGQLRIRVRYDNIIGPWFDYLFVSIDEMKKILEGTGWIIDKMIEMKDNPSYTAIIKKI